MNLYLISQTENHNYDTYDAAVVRAESEEDARSIHPNSAFPWSDDLEDWASSPSKVKVVLLAENVDGVRGVVLASFNAG